jgi:hypothetical protein
MKFKFDCGEQIRVDVPPYEMGAEETVRCKCGREYVMEGETESSSSKK